MSRWTCLILILFSQFSAHAADERPADLAAWIQALEDGSGSPKAGKVIFQASCAACHRETEEEGAPGMTLSSLKRSATRELILKAHLAPRSNVPEEYSAYVIVTAEDETISGVIHDEAEDTLTLRTTDGFQHIETKDIRIKKKLSDTLKPPGLFDALDIDEVRDLISWLTLPDNAAEKPSLSELVGTGMSGLLSAILPDDISTYTLIEGEGIKAKSESGILLGPQTLRQFTSAHWSGGAHLWWRKPEKINSQLSLPFSISHSGEYQISAIFTRATSYGIFDIYLDDQTEPIVSEIDLYGPKVAPTSLVEIASTRLDAGTHHLRVVLVGLNPKAIQHGSFGLDLLLIKALVEGEKKE